MSKSRPHAMVDWKLTSSVQRHVRKWPPSNSLNSKSDPPRGPLTSSIIIKHKMLYFQPASSLYICNIVKSLYKRGPQLCVRKWPGAETAVQTSSSGLLNFPSWFYFPWKFSIFIFLWDLFRSWKFSIFIILWDLFPSWFYFRWKFSVFIFLQAS